MIRNIMSANAGGLAAPPTINQTFSSSASPFTLSGGASLSSGNLNLLTSNDKAQYSVPTFGRGWFAQCSAKMRDEDFSIMNVSIEKADGQGYQIEIYCDPLDDISVVSLTKNNGASGFPGPDYLGSYVAGNYLAFFSSFNTFRLECPASGNLVIKLNGTIRINIADVTHSEFTNVALEHVFSGGGFMTTFNMGAL